ncbi:MAG: isochorismatase family protein [Gemmatimonadota bacterium]|nr:isochorismatase family protein [Gemmatimonadota bacterium]MDE2864381.1 isochorismatase family protein [Gemmatimonadota bacterium]MXV96580.1 isochorismatase family protein [Gemmatimonadota bacterium]MYE16701.1 isochorismatase family protein [Gemmatimonadota bacterium]
MSAPTRDPRNDHLLSPENSALVLIDYQPSLVAGTHSIERAVLVNNVVAMAKAARLYSLPTILSTVGVAAGYQQDTIPELREVLADVSPIDRNTVDAWDTPAFREAVEATGRRKIIMGALWTEVCLAYPALNMLIEGYEIYALSDVSGGTTLDAHERGMQRLIQAGAVPVTWEAVMAELGRLGSYDIGGFIQIMNEHLPRSVPSDAPAAA